MEARAYRWRLCDRNQPLLVFLGERIVRRAERRSTMYRIQLVLNQLAQKKVSFKQKGKLRLGFAFFALLGTLIEEREQLVTNNFSRQYDHSKTPLHATTPRWSTHSPNVIGIRRGELKLLVVLKTRSLIEDTVVANEKKPPASGRPSAHFVPLFGGSLFCQRLGE
jgi:hypothetical protein